MIACVVLPRPDAALARRLFAVSPLLQREGALVFLDDRGLARLHGGPAGLFAAIRRALAPETPLGLALAANRFTAEVAARCLRRPVTVREGEEALFLSRLPLSALPLPPDLARRLLPLGLETLGDFASLPSAGIERRYGQAGVALHRLARGLDARGLLPEREPHELCVERQLDSPVDRLPLLLPALEEALARLCPVLTAQGQGATRLALDLSLDDALPDDEAPPPSPASPDSGAAARSRRFELSLPDPEDRAALLLDLLRLELERHPPGAAVVALRLQAPAVAPLARHQNALFGEVARDASRRTEAVARLAALFGPQAVATPRLRRAHRLEERWEVPEPALATKTRTPAITGLDSGRDGTSKTPPALRVLPVPEELVPLTVGGQLTGFRRGRSELRIVRAHGPRRLTGGWWRQPWARDEYELMTPDGALYRVGRDLHAQRWLLLAEAD
jgi:protein ImuB